MHADQALLEEEAVTGGKPSSMMANPEGLSETGAPACLRSKGMLLLA